MVRLPEGYCIDSTEVTRAQYQAWLDAKPSTAGQVGACARNTTFVADASCMASPDVCDGACDDHPQVCVDWCDAFAYCKAAGKRLCGRMGGGSIVPDGSYDWVNASVSQWYNACSSHDQLKYTYGNIYEAGVCNGDMANGMTVPVGSLAKCQSPIPGYEGVYDLLGNVAEWEDACTEPGFSCRIRGGDFYRYSATSSASHVLFCRADSSNSGFTTPTSYIGFRCCSAR